MRNRYALLPSREVAMEFSDLSPELKEKARACKTVEEVLALAK